MLFTKSDTIKLKKLKKYFSDSAVKMARVKIVTYWVLFIPVYSRKEIIDLLSD